MKSIKKMTTEEIHVLMVEIAYDKLGVEKEEVTQEADFVKDLGADSLDLMEILIEIEAITGISIGDVKEGELNTVGDMEKLLFEKQG